MAIFVNPNTGKMSTTKLPGYIPIQDYRPSRTTKTSRQTSRSNRTTSSKIITIYRNGAQMRIPSGDLSYWRKQGWTTTKPSTTRPTTTKTQLRTNKPTNNILNTLLSDRRVKNDKKMQDWLRGNASLLAKLKRLGYTNTDIINEAYSWTRKNHSSFSRDMTLVPRTKNKPYTEKITKPTISPEQQAMIDQAGQQQKIEKQINDYIDSLPSDQFGLAEKAILKQIAKMDGRILKPEELQQIIADAAKNAEEDISPYYQVLTQRELEDLKNRMADIRNEAARYAQQEKLSYEQKLAQTKQMLRQAGLTFSGKPKQLLGTEGFMPAQMEGTLQKERRYNWEDARAEWQQQARNLGIVGERLLGSAKVGRYLGLQDPYAGTTTYKAGRTSPLFLPHQQGTQGYVRTGDLELQRKKAIEESKWDRIRRYKINI